MSSNALTATARRRTNGSICIALLDDHAAVREGLKAIVAPEPDLEVVGCAATEAELWPVLRRTCPDVLVLDVHHPGRGGLELCLRVKREPRAPAVLLYTASNSEAVLAAAALAGAGAVVCKSSAPTTLLAAIRELAEAPRTMLGISWRIAREIAARLDAADHAILAMALAGHVPDEIGDTLALPTSVVIDRIAAIIARLEPVGSAG